MAIGDNSPPSGWVYLERRFSKLFASLALTPAQIAEGTQHHSGVRACLNEHYYGQKSESANSFLTGSWSKNLAVRPPRDIDVLFILPSSVWHQRYASRLGNKQSQLLQEVKNVLLGRFSETDMRGDGQAVVVDFARMPVEVVVGFYDDQGRILICNTENEGHFQYTDPYAEAVVLEQSDQQTRGMTRLLIRSVKQWQRLENVAIKSFMIERLAVEFMDGWKQPTILFWIDWILRDFFAFMISRKGGTVLMPGTGRIVQLGDKWVSAAKRAHESSSAACDHEYANENLLAGLAWQEVFGPLIPEYVT